jgi:hypothetical protein
MKVYLGFSRRAGNLLSGTIQLLDGTNYSHVYMRVESKYGEYVYQASGVAVNFTNIDTFREHNQVVEEYEFEVQEEGKTKLLTFFIKYAGKSYSLRSLFELAAILICSRVGIKAKFNGDGSSTFICSELGALFCEEVLGIDITEDEDFVTPKSLNPYAKKYGKRVV